MTERAPLATPTPPARAAGGPTSPQSSDSRRRGKRPSEDQETGKRQPKIHRVSRACDSCKLRKSRCNGTSPCEPCVSRGLQCHYLTKYGRGRPPTPTPLSVCSADNDGTSQNGPRHSARIDAFQPVPTSTEWLTAQSGHATPIQSRASPEAGITEIQGQYFDPTSGLAFLHRAWKRLSSQKPRPVDDGIFLNTESHQAQITAGDKPFDVIVDGSPPIPERSDATQLFTFYFDVCIATYRFLHRPTAQQWLDRLLLNVEERLPLTHGLGELPVAIVTVMLAIAIYHRGRSQRATSATEEILSTQRSDQLFVFAARMIESASGFPHLESVQARLIQVLYLLHTSRMNQAWYVFGNALQMIAALGLHRREGRTRKVASKSSQTDYIKSQCRKRTFWVAYILDQYLGVIFGRPRHYHDQDIDQVLPDCVDDEDMTAEGPKTNVNRTKDCSLTSLVFHARICKILGNISREIYSVKQLPREALGESVSRFTAELQEWKGELPSFLGAINPSSLVAPFRRQATALRLAHSHAIMHAKRPFLLRNIGGDQEPSEAVKEHIMECISAARLVLEMVHGMASDGTLFHAFWWTHYVTFCALAVVYIWEIQHHVHGAMLYDHNDQERLFELAERCQTYLADATASNSPSRRYSIILQELREEANHRTAGVVLHSLSHGSHSAGLGPEQTFSHLGREGAARDLVLDPSIQGQDWTDGMHNVWGNWQTTDWLDIDSLAFGQFQGLESSPGSWLTELPNTHQLL